MEIRFTKKINVGMIDEPNKVFLNRQRGARSFANVCGGFILIIVVALLIPVWAAPWMSWWIRLSAAIVLALYSYLFVRWVIVMALNPAIYLVISRDGIRYGCRFFEWSEISQIYPRRAWNMIGPRKYQLGYKVRMGFQVSNDLPVDGGLSENEYDQLVGMLELEVASAHPHVRVLHR